ncbi:MAG: FHA domain-containing protein [Kofleriaceae bacterium]
MFLKYLDFVFAPFRAINNKIVGARNIKGNIQVDVNRSKALAQRGKTFAAQAGQMSGQGNAGPPGTGGSGVPAAPGVPGMPSAPGAAPPPSANPPIRTTGILFKKRFCTQCDQQLDKSWDSCPFCAQRAQQLAAVPQAVAKTQALVLDGGMQLLGWIVALEGPHRGELFTLSPVTTIGTDPACTVRMQDQFMSAKHAEIKAENGVWILRDTGSTNGTYVNNKRVDRHELVDNDFVKFGSAQLKFKSL